MNKQTLSFLRVNLVITSVLSIWAFGGVRLVMQALAISLKQTKWLLLCTFFVTFAIFAIILLSLTWHSRFIRWLQSISKRVPPSSFYKTFSIVLFWAILAFISGIVLLLPPYSSVDARLNNTGIHWWLLWIFGIVAALVLKAGIKKVSFEKTLLTAFLGEALLYKLVVFFSHISSYPFALNWEESYRLYYASLVAARRIYGVSVPLSSVDFSLNLINGIPFLLGNMPILVIRLWFVLLGIGITALTAVLLCRRLRIQGRLIQWLFVSWLFLFFLEEGGIKYVLLICVAIIYAGVSGKHPWRSFISVILASIWAGLSRINWFPVPGMLAAGLFLLEEPVEKYKSVARYLTKPVLWGVIGFAVSILPGLLIPEMQMGTTSGFNSALLWYRLLPNPTYSPGILFAIMLASFPLLWVCFALARGRLHLVRVVGLVLIVGILFAGGLIVSMKIGGGSDLHNLDAYLTLLVTIGAYTFFDRLAGDQAKRPLHLSWPIIALAVIIPVCSALQPIQLFTPNDQVSVNRTLQFLKQTTGLAAQQGEVLFMYQRQLLTFGYVHVPLVAKYENVYILEYAMSSNKTELNKFYDDLRSHQFSLIVTEGLPGSLKGSKYSFGEENDAWFTKIALPLLCNYQRVAMLPVAGVELYTPRSPTAGCSSVTP